MIFLFFSPAAQMAIFCNDDNYIAPKGLKNTFTCMLSINGLLAHSRKERLFVDYLVFS